MFDECSSTKHIIFIQTSHGNQKAKFAKNIQNSTQKLYGR